MALPTFVNTKHTIGLGTSSGALKGFMVQPGSYRRRVQERDNRRIVVGERQLQDYKVSQWSQNDFSGGQYQDILEDTAMFALGTNVLPSTKDRRRVRTTPVLVQATDGGGAALSTSSYAGLANYKQALWCFDKLYVLGSNDYLYMLTPSTSVEGRFTVTSQNLKATGYSSGTPTCIAANRVIGTIFVGYGNGDMVELQHGNMTVFRRFLWSLTTSINAELTSWMRQGGIKALSFFNGYGVAAMRNRVMYWDGGNTATTADAYGHCTACAWTFVGDATDTPVGFIEYQNLLLVVNQAGNHTCTIDSTNLSGRLMPWLRVPYVFTVKSVASYAGRLYLGGSGYDMDGTATIGQLFEMDGSSFRELRTWYDLRSQFSSTTTLAQVGPMSTHEGLLIFGNTTRSCLEAYDFITDGFFSCFSVQSGKTASPVGVYSAGARLLVLCSGTHGGLYYIPTSNTHSVAPVVETSEFGIEPSLDKKWLFCDVHSRYGPTTLSASVDGGQTWSSCTLLSTTQSGYNFKCHFQLTGLSITPALRLKIDFGTGDSFSSSTYYWRELVEFTVGFLVKPPTLGLWDMAFHCTENTELLDGVLDTTDPDEVVAQLWSWYTAGTVLVLRDREGTDHNVCITLIQEAEPHQRGSTSREVFVTVTLAEVTYA